MKLNSSTIYALVAFAQLSADPKRLPVTVAKMATAAELPPKYLGQLMRKLAEAGAVKSVLGSKGGFSLARPPEQISLLQVMEAIEGPLNVELPELFSNLTSAGQRVIRVAFEQHARAARFQAASLELATSSA